MTGTETHHLLDVRDLKVDFAAGRGAVRVVDGVSLQVPHRKTVALVGESGCGKSVTALSMLRLLPEPAARVVGGQILLREPDALHPVDLLQLDQRRMRAIRGNRIAMIFQEPQTALNPVFSIGQQIAEAVELCQPLRGRAARDMAAVLLGQVGIADPERRARDYPHQLSGGMRQRAMIAMALACEPALLIADEPSTALDVTVQAQILDLLCRLQAETGTSMLLITHDLGVVAEVADYVYVMYAGRIVEHAPVKELFSLPLHPYTESLLRCTPRIKDHADRLETIPGSVPDPAQMPTGCRFHPRCRLTVERATLGSRPVLTRDTPFGDQVLRRCVEPYEAEASGTPELRELRPGHFVACWEADRVLRRRRRRRGK